MTRTLFIIGFGCLIFGCGQKKLAYYYDFDKVDHYSIQISEAVLYEIEEKENLNRSERLKIDLIQYDKPEKLGDSLFIQQLPNLGFEKHTVSEEKFAELNEIFSEKPHKEIYELACEHVYRDILIFKKSYSIIGIAKICFHCSGSQIIGTNANTTEFGQSGDYGKLNQLLKR